MIPGVVDTCRERRAWARPGPAPTPSVDLVMKQNEQVEADIMFYKDHLMWHMVDRETDGTLRARSRTRHRKKSVRPFPPLGCRSLDPSPF